ncbi:MAG: hypothetical protein BAJATHORv1_20401 [Candidatus Thorarchaeota archaeon]|nr:MAG: hypothetical protein BAJATHORv1_20401 [Candidatus Thorarchaeota archaeon]
MDLFETEELLIGLDGEAVPLDRFEVLEGLLKQRYDTIPPISDVKRFRSKKNVVFAFRAGNTRLVAKLFITDAFKKELEQLLLCARNGVNAPPVLAAKEGVILMPLISGIPLVDALNETLSESLTKLLAKWYSGYHSVTGLIKGDPRLRNFILHDRKIYGLDFEEAGPGDWMDDIGGVAASILDTYPIGGIKKSKLVWVLFYTYISHRDITSNLSLESSFTAFVADTLEATALWRENDELLKLAKNIRIDGIPR